MAIADEGRHGRRVTTFPEQLLFPLLPEPPGVGFKVLRGGSSLLAQGVRRQNEKGLHPKSTLTW